MSKLLLTMGTAAPSAATDGNPLRRGETAGSPFTGFGEGEFDSLVLTYKATVTAGQTATMSFLQLWGYSEDHSDWFPIGPVENSSGTDTKRGYLNFTVALGEILTDKINFSQVVGGLGAFSRVYLREGTSGGTGYASVAYLRCGK